MAITKLKDDPFKKREKDGEKLQVPTPIIKWNTSTENMHQKSINETDPQTWESINYWSK